MAQAFYGCNLATCLAERGLNFALLDFETRLPTASFLFGSLADEPTIADIIHPHTSPWDGLYEVCIEKHIIIDGRSAVKLISLTEDGLVRLSKDRVDPRIVRSFRRLFADLDLTLINLPAELVGNAFLLEMPVQKFLFVGRPDLKEVMRTFELIKQVSGTFKSGVFGLLVHRADDIGEVRSTFTSLARAVRGGLGKDLRFMGQFPDHPLIAESVLSRAPLALDERYPELKRRFWSLAGYIVSWVLPGRESSTENEAVAL
jgi:MinD-like ATPase involved in chromosome partitioning or flagellar assembly